MKVIATTYLVQTRANGSHRWQTTYYSLKTKAHAKIMTRYLVSTLDWRILRHQEVVEVVDRSPKKPRPKVVRQKKVKAKDCSQWPHCACIVKGTVQTCVPTDGPLRKH